MESNRGLLDFDLNVALPCEENWNGNGTEFVREEEKSRVIVAADADSVVDVDPEERNRRWNALLDVAEMARREYEESNRRKSRKRVSNEPTRQRMVVEENEEEEDGDGEFVVVRSSRGRTVAMPNKYRDSVLEPVAAKQRSRTRLSQPAR